MGKSKIQEPCAKSGCGKMRGENSELCPHHLLLKTSEADERSRRAKRSAATRERKTKAREFLKISPLRAENPLFHGRD